MEPNGPFQPQANTQVPPPPTPEVGVRTMASDNQSVQQGAAMPEPQMVTAPVAALETPLEGVEAPVAKSSKKALLWTLVTILVVVGLGLLGYFVIYPLFSASPVAEPVAEEAAESALPIPEEAVVEIPAPVHASAFVVAAAATVEAPLPAVTGEAIRAALTVQSDAMANGATNEIVFRASADNSLVNTAAIFTALLPDFLDAASASNFLSDDPTVSVYKNEQGSWPSLITELKAGFDTTLFAQWLSALEQNNLAGFFLTDPGALAAFKTGEVKGIADRYASGQNGASFSYAIVNNNWLIIHTSFEGLKEALTLLGI